MNMRIPKPTPRGRPRGPVLPDVLTRCLLLRSGRLNHPPGLGSSVWGAQTPSSLQTNASRPSGGIYAPHTVAPRRRLKLRLGQQPADAGRRHPEAELGQLAADPPMAPARILACEPQYQLPNLRRQARPSTPAHRLSPLLANERLMPAQKRPRSYK